MKPLPTMFASRVWWHRICQGVFHAPSCDLPYAEICLTMFNFRMQEWAQIGNTVGGAPYLPDPEELLRKNPSH